MSIPPPIKFILLLKVTLIISIINSLNSILITVKNINDLNSQIQLAKPGDTIYLANGNYTNTILTLNKNNLQIIAETPGKVYFTNENRIIISGNNNTISGFQFVDGSLNPKYVVIEVTGNFNLITQCNWSGYSAQKYILLDKGTQYNTISYCNMEKKPTTAPVGCLIQILPDPSIPNYHKISYCTFQNFLGTGGDNGNEPIRIGLGALSNFASRTIVEYCYWNNTGLADSESISIKSMENVIRYNVFDNNKGAMLVFRNGDNNIAYSNIFIRGSGGIRVKEANNILCFNNYFDGSLTDLVNNAIKIDYTEANEKNVTFIHNTFIESTIDLGELLVFPKKETSIYFVNNIFSKKIIAADSFFTSSKAAIAPNLTLTLSDIANFDSNIFELSPLNNYDKLLKGDKNMFVGNRNLMISNLELTYKSDGYVTISSKSSAVNSATNSYQRLFQIEGIEDYFGIQLDINKNMRPLTSRDVGCEEYLLESNTNKGLVNLNIPRGPIFMKYSIIQIQQIQQSQQTPQTPQKDNGTTKPSSSNAINYIFINSVLLFLIAFLAY